MKKRKTHTYLFCASLEDEESGTEEVLSMVLVNTPLGRKETRYIFCRTESGTKIKRPAAILWPNSVCVSCWEEGAGSGHRELEGPSLGESSQEKSHLPTSWP